MLELGPRELVTLGTVLAGLAATWGVLKTTIRGMVNDLEEYKQELNDIATRLDKAEAKMAVAISSIDIMSHDILSPQILKKQSERDGAVDARLRSLSKRIVHFNTVHNGSHPPEARGVV